MKAVRPAIASDRVPYLQTRSVGSHSTSGGEEEGKDGVIMKGGTNTLTQCARDDILLAASTQKLAYLYYLAIRSGNSLIKLRDAYNLGFSMYLVITQFYLRKNHNSSSPFRENINVIVFPFPFHIFMLWPTCGISAFKDSFPS